MPQLDLTNVLLQWLRAQRFTPQLRLVQGISTLPPAAYPCVRVLAMDERFTQAGTDSVQAFTIRVECAAGRSADAAAQVRSLARQIRSALHRSHGLAGAVQHLRTEGITYSQREAAGEPVTAVAELALVALGCEQ